MRGFTKNSKSRSELLKSSRASSKRKISVRRLVLKLRLDLLQYLGNHVAQLWSNVSLLPFQASWEEAP